METVELCLSDNHNAWDLGTDGVWVRRVPGADEEIVNAQETLMRLHAAHAADAP
jgi:polyphosphate kinase